MHSLCIVAAFFVIVFAPCAAALWGGSEPSVVPVQKAQRVTAKRLKSYVVEIADPVPAVESQRRSILMKCARSNQFRHLHLHEFRATADAASIVRLSVRG